MRTYHAHTTQTHRGRDAHLTITEKPKNHPPHTKNTPDKAKRYTLKILDLMGIVAPEKGA